jgi:hypothetical protein
MPNTYTELLKTTVGTATSSVTFDLTGISGYTDLVFVATPLCSTASNLSFQFNGDTGTNYSATGVAGSGSSAASWRQTSSTVPYLGYYSYTDTNSSSNIISIMNYSNSTTNKTFLCRASNATAGVEGIVGTWRNTAAITSVVFKFTGGANFNVGSTFSLYGIANADQGAAKATGGIITEDSQYWYHTFAASGAFVPKQSLTCDVLVIAGGGGGGRRHGGGGGAGGVSYQSGRSVTATTYNITVGGGGAGGGAASPGATASNSVFDTITSNGGGGGGGGNNVGLNGGSGGGGSGFSIYVTPGTATQGNTGGATGYGFAGATAAGSSNNVGAGGGGSSETPAAATNTVAGNGGAGLNTWSTWTTPTGTGVNGFFAGGGGGAAFQAVTTPQGTGGSGGGGAGSHSGIATAGVTNTGSGGGGQGNDTAASGAGGSGVVIVRYLKA